MEFHFHEVTAEELNAYVKDELERFHPHHLAEVAFPEDVMKIIASDHHKSRDGCMTIGFDFWAKKWFISHSGYVRHEIEVEADSYLKAAQKFAEAMREANAQQLFYQIEEKINKQLPKDIYVAIDRHSITLKQYAKGEDSTRTITFVECEEKSNEEIEKEALKLATEFLKPEGSAV